MLKSCSGLSTEVVESLKKLKTQKGKAFEQLSCLEQKDGADDLQIPSSNIILSS